MKKVLQERRLAIRERAKARDPKEIPYFKRIALDRDEHHAIRKEALIAIGGFDFQAIEPLTEIVCMTRDEKDTGISKSAFGLLHALNQSEHRERWDRDIQLKLNATVWACAGLIEGLA